MKQRVELSTQELEDLKVLVESIEEEVKETEKKIARLKESLAFLSLVLQNILEEK
jgi:predicted  nucleic acid-binding Zn-ribbon protein